MSVLVVGSVALDTIKTPFGKKKEILGGSATYFSVAASVFNPVSIVAVVGSDFPEKYLALFRKKKIDTRGLAVKKGKTFRWEGEYGWDFGDPKTIATHLNVFGDFDPHIPPEYKNKKYVFLANIDPRLQLRVLREVRKPRIVACDTMNYWIEKNRPGLLRLLRFVDIFLLNESEIRELTGESSLPKASRALRKFGPEIVIIKRGEHGSLLFTGHSVFSTPAYLMETIVDPTGAGDTFAGGFMGYLAKCGKINQANLRKAVVYGSVMATFAVEDFSLGHLATIGRNDIMRRLGEYKKLTRF